MHQLIVRLGAGITAAVVSLVGVQLVTGPTEATAQSDSDGVRIRLESLYAATWGNPRARQALEVIAYVDFHQRTARCLQDDGWGHTAGAFVDAIPGTSAVGWDNSLLPVDADSAAAHGFGTQATVHMVTPRRQWLGDEATPEAQQDCEKKVRMPLNIPAVDPELDAALYELTGRVVQQTPSASPDAYATCMSTAGYTIKESRNQFVSDLVDQRVEGVPTTNELNASSADTECRATGHAAVMAGLAVPLAAFETQHRDRLASLADRPDKLQADAVTAAQSIELAVDWI
jgi:hypothetical protein